MLIGLILLIITLCLFKIFCELDKKDIVKEEYTKALYTARKKDKKLLVIGSPYTGVTGYFGNKDGAYPCGDICIDLLGCNPCPNSIKANLNGTILNKLETNKYVVFEAETIEYADKNKIDDIIYHINRISGGDVYSVHTIGGLHTTMGKAMKFPIYAIVYFQRWAYRIFFPEEGGIQKQLITNCPSKGVYEYLSY